MCELSVLLNMKIEIVNRQFYTHTQVCCWWKCYTEGEEMDALNRSASLKNHSSENKKAIEDMNEYEWRVWKNYLYCILFYTDFWDLGRFKLKKGAKINNQRYIDMLNKHDSGALYKYNFISASRCLLKTFSEVIFFLPFNKS